MVKSRFVVLRMKDIIRTGIFIVIGIVLLIALIWFIMPNRDTTQHEGVGAFGSFVPGTYTSYIVLHNRPVTVSVTVDEDSILDISISELEEVVEVFYPLINPTMAHLSQQVIRTQSTSYEASVERLHTSRILLEAIDMALEQARNPENGAEI